MSFSPLVLSTPGLKKIFNIIFYVINIFLRVNINRPFYFFLYKTLKLSLSNVYFSLDFIKESLTILPQDYQTPYLSSELYSSPVISRYRVVLSCISNHVDFLWRLWAKVPCYMYSCATFVRWTINYLWCWRFFL